MTTTALIVAAGAGVRFGQDKPKQYQLIGGVSLLRRSVMAFLHHPCIQEVRVVINPAHRALYEEAVAGLALGAPIEGGASRQDSVRLGLEALAKADQPPLMVMIHDAARPFVSAATIEAVHKALRQDQGALAARPVVDTLKHVQDELVTNTVARENLWHAQTPQAFPFGPILKAHQLAKGQNLTDDAAVAELAGLKVHVVMSDADNFKITTPDDQKRAERLVADLYPYVCTGIGLDVHRLVAGCVIHLGGLALEHDRALEGHSDADVVLHALTDALLGTLGAGDIGTFFPPSDPQWQGADSALFLRHAATMIAQADGMIAHVDIVIMCEAPRLAPHRVRMQNHIASLLGLAPRHVSVKATTTERLGFTGRGEGIAAQAIATVRYKE
ncbi:MAG: bifunctional 2-C-methyl-D-erythritol 4-phosphate cytidylyltransferase/2-C-methyl-D-erythritol 2,4-cyclodiphosphate synthase [Alphaproteobacteria bacterium]|nr:bifunctional 2-C-methyl-D-erythritol 4-phosphate cytidylyltransferase/2-C-methyl-D-erythritol 2,4-cyclodiphosphate synthase [Alphaproteobacteria bacterium]